MAGKGNKIFKQFCHEGCFWFQHEIARTYRDFPPK